MLMPLRFLRTMLCASTLAAHTAHAQRAADSEHQRHWTFSALGGVSSLALGGGGAAEVWSRVGPVRGGEGLLAAAAYGGKRWGIEAAYGQGHGSLAEFTASTLALALTVQRHLGFASTEMWDTRLGIGFVRTGVSVPEIPLTRFELNSSASSIEQLLLGNGMRSEVSVMRRSSGRVRLNARLGADLSGLQGTVSPTVSEWGRMTSLYLRFGVALRR